MGENAHLLNSLTKNFEFNKPLASFSGYKTGGNAFAFFEPKSLKSLCECIDFCKEYGLEYKIIGKGSNLLISDNGYKGIVISLKKLSGIEFYKGGEIRVGAGVNLSKLIDFCAINGLAGIETLAGIPASVGGATVMNAGAFLTCISDFITVVETVKNGKFYRIDKNDCNFSYRKSKFLHSKEIVVSVRFLFNKDSSSSIRAKIENYLLKRKNLQPQGRTCGSVFKNPKGYYAGELIERASLKGVRIGGAEISKKHANIIVANKNCTSQDVYKLIRLVKYEVFSKFHIKLNEEIEYLGDF